MLIRSWIRLGQNAFAGTGTTELDLSFLRWEKPSWRKGGDRWRAERPEMMRSFSFSRAHIQYFPVGRRRLPSAQWQRRPRLRDVAGSTPTSDNPKSVFLLFPTRRFAPPHRRRRTPRGRENFSEPGRVEFGPGIAPCERSEAAEAAATWQAESRSRFLPRPAHANQEIDGDQGRHYSLPPPRWGGRSARKKGGRTELQPGFRMRD